jgi:hypothetical protein
MTLTRQQKRQIERKARAYMAAVDADLVAKLRAEKRSLIWFDASVAHIRSIDPTIEYVPPSQSGMIS